MSSKAPPQHDADVCREFLIAMRSGANITAACVKVGIERDGRLKWLRKKYPEFNKQVQALRWSPGRTAGFGTSKRGDDHLRSPEREWGTEFEDKRVESFLLTYRETKDKDSAARASGFLPSTVQGMLDPSDKRFHAEFARAFREEEIREGWSIEDDLRRQATAGDAVSQRWWLERRMPEYGQRAKSATESNDAKFNQDSLRSAMEELRKDLLEFRQSAGRVGRANPDAGTEEPAADNAGVGEVSGKATGKAGIN